MSVTLKAGSNRLSGVRGASCTVSVQSRQSLHPCSALETSTNMGLPVSAHLKNVFPWKLLPLNCSPTGAHALRKEVAFVNQVAKVLPLEVTSFLVIIIQSL